MTTQTDKSKTLDDLKPIEIFEYASYLPGRTNGAGGYGYDFRRHKTLSHARSAISGVNGSGKAGAKVYKWSGDVFTGSWEEI